jgi:hypothetical protein
VNVEVRLGFGLGLGLKFSSLFLRILGVSRHDAKRKTGNKKASEILSGSEGFTCSVQEQADLSLRERPLRRRSLCWLSD